MKLLVVGNLSSPEELPTTTTSRLSLPNWQDSRMKVRTAMPPHLTPWLVCSAEEESKDSYAPPPNLFVASFVVVILPPHTHTILPLEGRIAGYDFCTP